MEKLAGFLVVAGLFMVSTVEASCPQPDSNSVVLNQLLASSYNGGGGMAPFVPIRTIKGVIREIRDDGSLRVWDKSDGEEIFVELDDHVAVWTRRRAFKGRRILDRSDLRVGQRIKVSAVLGRDARVFLVKVLPQKGQGRQRAPERSGRNP